MSQVWPHSYANASHKFAYRNLQRGRHIAWRILLTMGSMAWFVASVLLAGLRHSGSAYSIEAAGVFHESHDP